MCPVNFLPLMMYGKFVKPFLDFVLALVAVVILSPLILVVWLGLTIANNGKPFFFQQRPGKDGNIFWIVKFKTMNDKRGVDGQLLPDADRLTPVGKFVRKTSLDELPQLFNVLTGDMSLIGPRPLLPSYLPLYNDFQRRRMEVKPGITGWAQVNGRNTISWEKKFEYDVWYVDHLSFLLDAKIFLLTVKKVVVREGINQEGHETSEEFKGNDI